MEILCDSERTEFKKRMADYELSLNRVRLVRNCVMPYHRVSNRRYRNRRIGDFLKELHLTEGRNTGFKKIIDELEANGSPKPEFETDEDRSYFITRLFVHEGFTGEVNQVNDNFAQKNERSFERSSISKGY